MIQDFFHWLPPVDPTQWGNLIPALTSHAAGWPDVVSAARQRLTFPQVERLSRLITKGFPDGLPKSLTTRPIRLAVLGSSTVEHLLPSIKVAAARHDLWVDTYVTPFGQYWQEIEQPNSGLTEFRPNFALLALDAAHMVAGVADTKSRHERDEFIDRALARLRKLWSLLKDKRDCDVIQQSLLPVLPRLVGSNEHRSFQSPANAVSIFNHRLREVADAEEVDVLAIEQPVEAYGVGSLFDPSLWHCAKQEVAPSAAPVYGELVARILAARSGKSCKCLVLDLDNTLWGGTIGEDGLHGIVLGAGSPSGEAYTAFQRYIKSLGQRGVILAVCSKNHDANGRAPFLEHPEMVLRDTDIAAFAINWEDKPSNLRALARQLNIGLDSMVFVDDTPFERDIVRRELPMVRVPEMPDDPAQYTGCISLAGYFEQTHLTEEDFNRGRAYQDNARRAELLADSTDLEGYLRSLQMELHYGGFDAVNRPRITQLINKTNQFNLTTRRYSEAQVEQFASDSTVVAVHLRLIDRLGDSGIIGVIIAVPGDSPTELVVDTWLMSCRVLGRQVEDASMNILADMASRRGARSLSGRFIPTAKNSMVAQHYARLGFAAVPGGGEPETRWRMDLAGFVPRNCPVRLVEAAA